MSQLNWYGREALKMIDQKQHASMEAAAAFLVQKVQESISHLFPPASDPYMPPHLRSGVLHDSIKYVWDGDAIQLGSDAPYAHWLELGTSKMMPRPFILPAVVNNLAAVEKIIGKEATR